MIISVAARLLADDIETEMLQLRKVTVQRLAFRGNIIFLELLDDFRHRQGMLVIRVFHENFRQIK